MAENRKVFELNTIMMRNTFKIAGDNSMGTCFLIGRPSKSNPNFLYFILVTAAHVLENMKSPVAMLHLRKKQNDSYIKFPVPINICQGNNPLWTKNGSGLDVAVMPIELPNDIDHQLLPTNLLADDNVLAKHEIHPGDEMFCLGFPFGFESNAAGFPVLRSGKVASFPLIPTQMYPNFLLDFQVYRGNSGGPVYFVESSRNYAGLTHLGQNIQFVAGLVSEEVSLAENTIDGQRRYPLHLASIIQASHILNTINQSPERE